MLVVGEREKFVDPLTFSFRKRGGLEYFCHSGRRAGVQVDKESILTWIPWSSHGMTEERKNAMV